MTVEKCIHIFFKFFFTFILSLNSINLNSCRFTVCVCIIRWIYFLKVLDDCSTTENQVVIGGLSNTYSSYVTTYEEYQVSPHITYTCIWELSKLFSVGHLFVSVFYIPEKNWVLIFYTDPRKWIAKRHRYIAKL